MSTTLRGLAGPDSLGGAVWCWGGREFDPRLNPGRGLIQGRFSGPDAEPRL
jgi:hypothetical protein